MLNPAGGSHHFTFSMLNPAGAGELNPAGESHHFTSSILNPAGESHRFSSSMLNPAGAGELNPARESNHFTSSILNPAGAGELNHAGESHHFTSSKLNLAGAGELNPAGAGELNPFGEFRHFTSSMLYPAGAGELIPAGESHHFTSNMLNPAGAGELNPAGAGELNPAGESHHFTSSMLNPAGAGDLLRSTKKLKHTNHESSTSSSSSSGIDEPILPDDLIIEIVSWLPIKDALRFQSVCKRAKSLMSSPDFISINNKRYAPMVIVFNMRDSPRPTMLDRSWAYAKGRKSKAMESFRLYGDYIMQLSQDGLIVSRKYKNPKIFIIFNPIYSRVVKISVPDIAIQQRRCEIYGVFYQQCRKEYCTLWAFTVEPHKVQYKMLNLGSEPKWRDVTNPWTQNGRIQDIRPVLVNEYLYWVVMPERHDNSIAINVDILEFDTRKEVFEVIRSPAPARICNVNLLQANGFLMLVQFWPRTSSALNIWTLGNRSDKIWTPITVNANNIVVDNVGLTAVAIWNDDLLVRSDFSDLYVCNLKRGTARRFGRKCCHGKIFLPHVMSLASLENCKSDICMVEEGLKNLVK